MYSVRRLSASREKKTRFRAGFEALSEMVPLEDQETKVKNQRHGRTIMRFAYLTLDEVNQDLADRLAARRNIELATLDLRDSDTTERFDGIVYDLDSLPVDDRDRLIVTLTKGHVSGPIAVHSYNLTSRRKRTLRRRGVVVARRLSDGLIVRLRYAVRARSTHRSKAGYVAL